MATITQPADNDNSEQITPRTRKERSVNEVFRAKDALNQPCDVVLVVEDGKQFKAHRKVLSQASPFFEKLLNSDMKESKEGIVRLKMFSEAVMADTLEFIYTGHVQILTEDNARDLIVMADYLLLHKLTALAEGVLAPSLKILNCISTYYFSEKYQCQELLSKTKKFILTNFTAVYAANREDVLNMSSKEVEMWISSDEIDVSKEEDVFMIILAWIERDRSERKKYFTELFRQIRLVYVSRDFLGSDVVTNDLVKENEDCLDLVKDAIDLIDLIDSKSCHTFTVPPRKSLETPAIVVHVNTDFLCYFPGEDNWCRLGKIPPEYSRRISFLPIEGKLYGYRSSMSSPQALMPLSSILVNFNPYTNIWTQSPFLQEDRMRGLWKILVRNEKELYALRCDEGFPCTEVRSLVTCPCDREHSSYISKYKPVSNSWEDILSIDHFCPNVRQYLCIVASDHFIYFIGGKLVGVDSSPAYLNDVDRCDFDKGKWEKLADIQVARCGAFGATANGKLFIVGGRNKGLWVNECEVYDETTNEWQFICSLKKPKAFDSLLAADGKLYAVSFEIERLVESEYDAQRIRVECYNPEKNKWVVKTETAFPVKSWYFVTPSNACSMRIFKGLPSIRPLETIAQNNLYAATSTEASSSHKAGKRKCFIM